MKDVACNGVALTLQVHPHPIPKELAASNGIVFHRLAPDRHSNPFVVANEQACQQERPCVSDETIASTDDGAFADSPSLVVSTIDPTQVRFRAIALQADLVRLGTAKTGRIVPPTTPGIPIGDGVDSSIMIGLEAHPEQRTVTLLATPAESRAWIRPGVSAFLEVVAETTERPALAIPRSAIVKDGITHVFFRRDPKDPNKAIRVEADMGVDDGRWVAINSGLSLQDEVVLDGAFELKLATQQSGVTQKGGHFHADGTFHEETD